MDLASFTDQKINRKAAIGGGLIGLAGLVLPGQVRAQAETLQSEKSFVLLLKGLYHPVKHGPNLGLSTVDLSDGYSATKIYPVLGLPGRPAYRNEKKPIGTFYVQDKGKLCAYQIPGGTFSMRFTGQDVVTVHDGHGGKYVNGTYELTILEGTGIYKPFVGGHNHMVDQLHFLPPGDGSGGLDEYCFCFISQK